MMWLLVVAALQLAFASRQAVDTNQMPSLLQSADDAKQPDHLDCNQYTISVWPRGIPSSRVVLEVPKDGSKRFPAEDHHFAAVCPKEVRKLWIGDYTFAGKSSYLCFVVECDVETQMVSSVTLRSNIKACDTSPVRDVTLSFGLGMWFHSYAWHERHGVPTYTVPRTLSACSQILQREAAALWSKPKSVAAQCMADQSQDPKVRLAQFVLDATDTVTAHTDFVEQHIFKKLTPVERATLRREGLDPLPYLTNKYGILSCTQRTYFGMFAADGEQCRKDAAKVVAVGRALCEKAVLAKAAAAAADRVFDSIPDYNKMYRYNFPGVTGIDIKDVQDIKAGEGPQPKQTQSSRQEAPPPPRRPPSNGQLPVPEPLFSSTSTCAVLMCNVPVIDGIGPELFRKNQVIKWYRAGGHPDKIKYAPGEDPVAAAILVTAAFQLVNPCLEKKEFCKP